jgi:hypothetical protein
MFRIEKRRKEKRHCPYRRGQATGTGAWQGVAVAAAAHLTPSLEADP